ncbi:Spo75p, partial [Ascoidea rubescens DSM 1968]
FLGWVMPCFKHKLDDYLVYGLDSYFFLRFLKFLVLLFLGLSILNVSILVPINYYSHHDNAYDNYDKNRLDNFNGTSTNFLNQLTLLNISPVYYNRLTAHLVMAIISICYYYYLLFGELNHYFRIRTNYLLQKNTKYKPKFKSVNVIMIDNFPKEYLNLDVFNNQLFKSINLLPGGIKNVWFIYDFEKVNAFYQESKKILNQIEQQNTKLIRDFIRLNKNNSTNNIKNTQHNTQIINIQPNHDTSANSFINHEFNKIDKLIQKYHKVNKILINERLKFINLFQNGKSNDQKIIKTNKVLVEFYNPISPYLLNQLLISNNWNACNSKVIEIDPHDIIWENISIDNGWIKLARYFVFNALTICLIIFWIIPIIFISFLSQLPYLTTLLPFLEFLNSFPLFFKQLVSNFLPALFLSFLSELIPSIFYSLSFAKGIPTGSEIQIDIQYWLFLFFFINIFLIVALSIGLFNLVISLINNPISLLMIVSSDLSKASNFFLNFLILKGLSFFSGSLLQPYMIIQKLFLFCNFQLKCTLTPRAMLEKQLILGCDYDWGSIYPIFSLFGVIGITFSVINPIISIFCAIIFGVIIVSVKYNLKYKYSGHQLGKKRSETNGKLYPNGLLQLNSGIFFLEITLSGLFFVIKNTSGKNVCLKQGIVMICVLGISIYIECYINDYYRKNIYSIGLEEVESYETVSRNTNPAINEMGCFGINNFDYTFLHPSFWRKTEDTLWLPKDMLDLFVEEIEFYEKRDLKTSFEGYTKGSNVDIREAHNKLKLVL